MRRVIIGFVMLVFTAVSAEAVTLRDIIDLTKAGLGDDVLLALIEVDGRVFDVDSVTLTRLKAAGVSEKVIVALVRSGRVPAPVLAPEPISPESMSPQSMSNAPRSLSDVVAAQQAPQVIYIEQPPATVVREVAVPYPVYVGIPVSSRGRHGRPVSNPADGLQPSISSASLTAPPLLQGERRYLTDIPPQPKSEEPVYWGWGGKLRPDAWKPKQ
jgi:hypothetical protein